MLTLFIDGNFIAHQAFHAMGGLSHDGKASGVVFGILSRCLGIGHLFKTNRFIFCWDSPLSYRREVFPGLYILTLRSWDKHCSRSSSAVIRIAFFLACAAIMSSASIPDCSS